MDQKYGALHLCSTKLWLGIIDQGVPAASLFYLDKESM